MKNYNKPELLIEEININDAILASGIGADVTPDASVGWNQIFPSI